MKLVYMSNKFLIALLGLCLVGNSVLAQDYDEKTLLKKWKGKEIKYYKSDYAEWYQIRKKKKWGLYNFDDEIIPPLYDSIGWFENLDPYIIVKDNKKYGIFLNPFEISDALDRLKIDYDQIKTIIHEGEYYTIAKKGSKWGLIDWFEGSIIIPFDYEYLDDLVPLVTLSPWQLGVINSATKELEADKVEFDYNNGDGVIRARNRDSKHWGMYQNMGDSFTELIPMEYDSLNFFSWNGKFTAVYKDGKTGFYLTQWVYEDNAKQSVPCIYGAYKKINYNNNTYLAVQKSGKWGWVDWFTGEEKSEFIYVETEDLPRPNWEQ